jgi:hypothetical protein
MTRQDILTALQTAAEQLASGKAPASVAKDLVRLCEDMKQQKAK